MLQRSQWEIGALELEFQNFYACSRVAEGLLCCACQGPAPVRLQAGLAHAQVILHGFSEDVIRQKAPPCHKEIALRTAGIYSWILWRMHQHLWPAVWAPPAARAWPASRLAQVGALLCYRPSPSAGLSYGMLVTMLWPNGRRQSFCKARLRDPMWHVGQDQFCGTCTWTLQSASQKFRRPS